MNKKHFLPERDLYMYIFSRTLVETIKLLCLSLTCSAVFSMMIFQDDVVSIRFVCFVLNFVSLLLFLLAYFKNWQKICTNAFSPAEYWIPALVSYGIYLIFSTICYLIASNILIVSSASASGNTDTLAGFRVFYRYFFQHSRFLEPMLNKEYAFVSFILSHILMVATLIAVPKFVQHQN